MVLLRRVARPMLAGIFIVGGYDAFRHPETKTQAADPVAALLVDRVPQLNSSEQVIRLDGAVKVAAGTAFALGRFPRLSAVVLAGSLAPTTYAAHAFWRETDPQRKAQQRIQFLKNAGMMGGLLLAAADTEGKPSLGWRLRRRARKSSAATGDLVGADGSSGLGAAAAATGAFLAAAAHTVGSAASTAADAVKEKAPVVAGAVRDKAPVVAEAVRSGAQSVREQAPVVVDAVKEKAPAVADAVRDKAPVVTDAVRERVPIVVDAVHSGADTTRGQARRAAKRIEQGTRQARKRAAKARKQAAKQAGKTRKRIGR